jgi:starvation-inducible DNA-binding protein
MNATSSKGKVAAKAVAKPAARPVSSVKAVGKPPAKSAAKPTAKPAAKAAVAKSVVVADKAQLSGKASSGIKIDIGIKEQDRAKIAAGLAKVLADTYSLYLKTHNFHWNVVGPMFNTLHLMFEAQYDELALAVDLIAERIRALGYPAPGSYSEFVRLTAIPETVGVPTAGEMVALLVSGHETVARTARAIFPVVDAASDESTADLLTQRMQAHEKTAWMLRSLLQG